MWTQKLKCGHKSELVGCEMWTQNPNVDTKNGPKWPKIAVFGLNRSEPRNLYIYIAT